MKKVLFIFVLVMGLLTLGSCSFFEQEAEGVKDISFSENENGDVVVTITYYDEFETTKEKIIPSGLDGKDGVSVSIDVIREKDLYRNKVIMNLSDGTQQVMYVPDGVRIVGVTPVEFEGTNGMILEYSDGSTSDAIRLPKGETGNGIDIDKSSWTVNNDGSVSVTIYYTESNTPIKFTIPAGKKGEGIESITPFMEDGRYGLEIMFSSGEIETVDFARPALWYRGEGAPSSANNLEIVQDATVGDYFFDFFGRKIYVLQAVTSVGQVWDLVVDFSKEQDICIVTFDENLGEDFEHEADPFTRRISVKYGEYLLGKLYPATRPGYTFIGWATSPVVTSTTGFLTDLTPITSDLTVYAIWEKNE